MTKINPLAVESQNGSMADDAMLHESDSLKSAHSNSEQRKAYVTVFGLSIVTAFIGFALIIYWMLGLTDGVSFTDENKLGNWHPIIMYMFMFGNNLYAILIYRTHYSLSKNQLKWTHALLGFANIVMSLLGVAIMYVAHVLTNKPNLYSLHSWIGVSTNILYLSQLVAGLWAFLRPKTALSTRAKLMPWHRLAGVMILVLAALSAITGIAELVIFQGMAQYTQFKPVTFIANFAGIATIVSTILAVYLVTAPQYLRPKKPEERRATQLNE